MSAIASVLRRRWPEAAWAAFAAANLVVIVFLADWETIPFHFIWVSLTILYGVRVWSLRTTVVLLAAVVAVTALALAFAVARSNEGLDEMTEVPLMAAMFVAMVWHARRRQLAVEEARRLAETEHRLLERQREFVRDASHELRTPITVARGHAELVREASEDPRTIGDADIVIDELSRLSRLSERLLLLAAAEDAALLDLHPVAVRDLVVGSERRWSVAAKRTWLVDAKVQGTILGDADRLRDAVDALVENAINATEPGDAIRIAGVARGDVFVLEVSDSGSGIAPDQVATLFERFSRVDAPRTRSGGGTGLGLSIVKAVAEAHGGTVEAESAPGRGATFRILLPGFRTTSAPDDRASSPARLG